jgi:ribosomal protein S18 acetylase RimI-like enzyme
MAANVVVRDARADDAAAIAHLAQANGRVAVELAPELFRVPDAEGLVDFIAEDEDWRAEATNLALVADVAGEVAGYLEASIQPPLESAPWQGQHDLAETRLFINYVGRAPAHQRRGVATALVEAAEAWGCELGATVATLDTWIDSPMSVPLWERRMGWGYHRRSIIFRKLLG